MRPAKNDSIYRKIKKDILDKKLYPGQKLSENLLAVEHGVSRTPIREVIKRLERDGLVIIKPKSGTYVLRQKSRSYIEVFQVRIYLECLAYRLAIEKIDKAAIAKLKALLRELDALAASSKPVDAEAFNRGHYAFHLALIKLSGNRVLLETFERLALPSTRMMVDSLGPEDLAATRAEHLALLECLRKRDPRGEDLLRESLWTRVAHLRQAPTNDALP